MYGMFVFGFPIEQADYGLNLDGHCIVVNLPIMIIGSVAVAACS